VIEHDRGEVVPEARLTETEHGIVPEGTGWFVLNAREARWDEVDGSGRYCRFEGDEAFPQLGFNVHVLDPGERMAMYHGEIGQEDFLVLSGECLLIIQGEERTLRPFDLVHCPPWTDHVILGAGRGRAVIVCVGARPPEDAVRYPVEPAALRHGAGVARATTSEREAYAGRAPLRPTRYRAGDLPGA
jgi:uncharacterized cupin superfamily protein